ncbi:MAG: penicillin-binding protein 2 [Nitrospira sp.]|nr:penicillin-binding protein 2 [Nitrospira sp.]
MDKRINIAIYLVILAFFILLIRLWNLQIINGDEYTRVDKRNRIRIINIPAPRGIIYDRNKVPLVKNKPSFDISLVKEDMSGKTMDYEVLGAFVGLEPALLKKKIKNAASTPYLPVQLRQDLSFSEIARIEARKSDFPGLQVDVVGGREYVYGHAASHVLGFLGRLSTSQRRSPKYKNLPKGVYAGQYGIEKIYDNVLRGSSGKKVVEVDALGSIIQVVRIQRPIKGDDLELTIDIRLQQEAERSLSDLTGAVVAMSVDTGEVLALASAPSFDPNLFVRGINTEDWQRIIDDPEKPLLNRAVQGQYSPASTFKIISAIAALEEGIVNMSSRYYCNGSIYFGREFNCWKKHGHGSLDINNAIVESCDVYFYEIGKRLDIDDLAQYAFSYGLGRPTGIDMEREAAGIVPNTGWKLERKKERWFRGETLNSIIGQGYLLATPVQMARMTAAVVNGGKLLQPYLIIGDEKSGRAESEIKISKNTSDIIVKAMINVVSAPKGTGHYAKSEIVEIGGKTGTVQVVSLTDDDSEVRAKHRDHGWFIAFAPAEKPELAVAVIVEHGGSGSSSAAPIAKRIIEAYYKNAAGSEVEAAPKKGDLL